MKQKIVYIGLDVDDTHSPGCASGWPIGEGVFSWSVIWFLLLAQRYGVYQIGEV